MTSSRRPTRDPEDARALNDDGIDLAEHRAVRAEQDAENAAELIESEYVARVRQLARDAHADAVASLGRFAEEVRLRLAPNVHRYELLARQQYTALLAAYVAAALEAPHPASTPVEVAEGVADAFLATHSTGRDDAFGRACRTAVRQVVFLVQTIQAEDEERAAAEAEEQYAIEQHERDLDHAAAIGEDERRADGTYGHAEAYGVEL